ncbi:MAG: Fic family protein [Pseudobutyrivibrio sp.]|nr:Fic family protein [Pseudobutyrivibrio sp.]
MTDRLYCYPNTNVLKNKLGITDLNKLQTFERKLTMLRVAEINALHPFREGNGRSQREFIRQLAIHNGYLIKFSLVNDDEMLKASLDSFMCDYESMEQLISKCIYKM